MINDTAIQIKMQYPSLPIADIREILGCLQAQGIDSDKIDFYAFGKDITTDILLGNLQQEYGISITLKRDRAKDGVQPATKRQPPRIISNAAGIFSNRYVMGLGLWFTASILLLFIIYLPILL